MRGMYLASYRGGHHAALWFVVMVRVNPVFPERKSCLNCKWGVYTTPLPPPSQSAAGCPACEAVLLRVVTHENMHQYPANFFFRVMSSALLKDFSHCSLC